MSDEILSKIAEQVDEVGKAHHASIELLKSENTEGFKKAADDTAAAMIKIQELQGEKKAQDETILALEKRVARGMKDGHDKNDPVMNDYYKFIDLELRKGRSGQNKNDPELFGKAAESIAARHNLSVKTVLESIDPQGGFFVHPEFLSQRVERIFQTSPILQVANVITSNSKDVRLVIDDDEASSSVWIGEATPVPDGVQPDIGQLIIVAHKLKTQQQVTLEMIEDSSIDITSWIVNKASARQARIQNTAWMAGDGASKPRGILNYPAWSTDSYQRFALQHVDSGVDGQFTYDGLTNLTGELISDYQANARWMINRRNWADILQIKDTQDRPLYMMNNLLQVGASMVLLGKPLMFAEDVTVSDNSNASTNNIIYGDFEGYSITQRMGITVFVDQFTGADSDIIKYYITSRVGGALTNFESLKVGDNTA